jgi:hypothetical protein
MQVRDNTDDTPEQSDFEVIKVLKSITASITRTENALPDDVESHNMILLPTNTRYCMSN